jgi:hypothetical protein
LSKSNCCADKEKLVDNKNRRVKSFMIKGLRDYKYKIYPLIHIDNALIPDYLFPGFEMGHLLYQNDKEYDK